MANRTLTEYTESNKDAYNYTAKIDRMSSGQPGIMVIIESPHDPDMSVSVVVPDGEAFLAPVAEWLNSGTDERLQAWAKIAHHPFFVDCFFNGPLLDSMVAKLNRYVAESVVHVEGCTPDLEHPGFWLDAKGCTNNPIVGTI